MSDPKLEAHQAGLARAEQAEALHQLVAEHAYQQAIALGYFADGRSAEREAFVWGFEERFANKLGKALVDYRCKLRD
jgi:hypothetical protein